MPEFRTPVIEDKERVDAILLKTDFEGSLYSFAAIYSWASKYQSKIAFYNNALLVSGVSESLGLYFLYPVGQYDIAEIVDIMRKEAAKSNSALKIIAEKRQVKELYKCIGDIFSVEDIRDDWDYVYQTEDLAFLRGNRYHSKRNHISRLEKKYGNSTFSFEMIGPDEIEDCLAIENAWIEDKGDSFDFESVKISLTEMDKLGLSGGLLKLDNKPIAFTVGEPLLEDTFIIHVEKSLPGYDGAYQMINQLFAKTLVGKYQYINREEDMGIDGLRKSKMSYFPCKMIEKCVITERK